MNIEVIKSIFKSTNTQAINKQFKLHIDLKTKCEVFLSTHMEFETIQNIIKYILIENSVTLPVCKRCNNTLKYRQYQLNQKYCSTLCKNKVKTCIPKNNTLELRKQTCLKKYGVDNISKLKAVRDKAKLTMLKKYGTANINTVLEIQNLRKKNSLLKYNTEYPQQTNEFKLKFKKTRYKNGYKNLIKKLNNQCIPLFSESEYEGGYNTSDKEYTWKCVKCGNVFHDKIYPSVPRCLNCYPYLNGYSNQEKELIDFCKQYYPNLLTNDRTLIKPKELDIIIPELKLAIEFNGNYWHSNEFKNRNYHLNKTIECEKIGYRLIHIFEHEWLFKQDIVKSKLLSVFNVNQENIYARKCVIKEIDVKTKNEFLNLNHIQGEDKSNIKLGLYFNDVLVSVMTFCHSRFNKGYEWELSRYSSSKHVLGGAGKLLKYFERNYKPKSLITYADRRFSQGNLYYKLGFTFSHFSSPNYFYTKSDIVLSRIQCQKHKLKNLLGESNFNRDLSETENMLNNNYFKIYDCGNYVFVKEY